MTAAITDFSQYERLRLDADGDPAVLREVAGQFEALFLEILLKDMRGAGFGDPLFGNSGEHDMYRDLLDKQLAVEMSSERGIGLAELLVRQLGGAESVPDSSRQSFALPGVAKPAAQGGAPSTWPEPAQFADDLWPHATRAAERLGIAPEALLAQAALETGWGKHVMQHSDGGSSLNLFGIKAGSDWQGDTVTRSTLEYRDGLAQREVARFRAYPTLEAAFDDYVDFITSRPRYSDVVGHGADTGGFGAALQDAGYATDPRYAEKIDRIARGELLQRLVTPLKHGGNSPINALPIKAGGA